MLYDNYLMLGSYFFIDTIVAEWRYKYGDIERNTIGGAGNVEIA